MALTISRAGLNDEILERFEVVVVSKNICILRISKPLKIKWLFINSSYDISYIFFQTTANECKITNYYQNDLTFSKVVNLIQREITNYFFSNRNNKHQAELNTENPWSVLLSHIGNFSNQDFVDYIIVLIMTSLFWHFNLLPLINFKWKNTIQKVMRRFIKSRYFYVGSEYSIPNHNSQFQPSYTKMHVDKDTDPDFCVTAIGKMNLDILLSILMYLNDNSYLSFIFDNSFIYFSFQKLSIINYVVYLNSGNCTDFCGGNLRFASPDSNNSSNDDFNEDSSVR